MAKFYKLNSKKIVNKKKSTRKNKKILSKTNKRRRSKGGAVDEIDVTLFIEKLYEWLRKNNMCFLSGAFVIEDPDHRIYNILAYGKNIAACSNSNDFSKQVSLHYTSTHTKFAKGVNFHFDNICGPKAQEMSLQYFKLERTLDRPLKFLCGDTDNPNNEESKSVILFYPFIYPANDIDDFSSTPPIVPTSYVFMKLEKYPMNTLGHVVRYLDKRRKSTLPTRKEGHPYSNLEVDSTFYSRHNNQDKLTKYNSEMRQGNEIFLSKKLIDDFLNYYKNSTNSGNTNSGDIFDDWNKFTPTPAANPKNKWNFF